MENSHIQWCDHTFNPWRGCTKVSPGCAHCYAETLSLRCGKNGVGAYVRGGVRQRTKPAQWRKPVKWNSIADSFRRCVACGFRGVVNEPPLGMTMVCPICYVPTLVVSRPRVFCASLSDWLDEEVPIEWVADLLALIHATPNLDWLLLTKRPENWRSRIEQAEQHMLGGEFDSCVRGGEFDSWLMAAGWMTGEAPANVWIGTTVEDQARAEERIPALLNIPARVRFLSCEPLLEEVRLIGARETLPHEFDATGMAWSESNARYERLKPAGIDWVICGGESGAGARAMAEGWARSLREQCRAAGVAFFMKQLGGRGDARGALEQLPADLRVREFPAAAAEVAR